MGRSWPLLVHSSQRNFWEVHTFWQIQMPSSTMAAEIVRIALALALDNLHMHTEYSQFPAHCCSVQHVIYSIIAYGINNFKIDSPVCI